MRPRLSEEADDYPYIVVQLDDRWRIIECRNDIQWILQKLVGGRWRGQRYCRTLAGLKSSLTALCVDPNLLPYLPDRYIEGGSK